jgi:hypothetical protein
MEIEIKVPTVGESINEVKRPVSFLNKAME